MTDLHISAYHPSGCHDCDHVIVRFTSTYQGWHRHACDHVIVRFTSTYQAGIVMTVII